MSTYLIIDEPLPLSQDFQKLKALGLQYIQEHSGDYWSNLNPSDPGITILDQVCYALTELGYVNGFPMADILTKKNGDLQIRDQFFIPEEFLTTTPLTIDDYRKYIIDGIAGVTNVELVPAANESSTVSGIYNVYLQLDETIAVNAENTCLAVFFYLNKRRNLDEFFEMPQVLHKDSYLLGGRIEITSELELEKILLQLNESIRNYIFPDVKPQSYQELNASETAINEVFNGPLLMHGWIPASALGTKREQVYVFELFEIVNLMPQITSASNFSLTHVESPSGIVYPAEAIIFTVDILKSYESGLLEVYCKGERIQPSLHTIPGVLLGRAPGPEANIMFGATASVQTHLPKGIYRDIESYYSIQNTFPEIYAVGADAVELDAPDYQVAQSRQLKGYLTLFDQVLANQFSQLANLGRLFSFKNAISDEDVVYRRSYKQYPAPYRTFSPTFFYQPLYDVPHIKPLLKNNSTFDFGLPDEDVKVREEKSWTAYKNDPYNPYIRGLMELMEDEHNSVLRRNAILDHLLAQNGESPYIINQVIDPLLYAGDAVKGQIIFKSLYLQNLGLISYYRQKAYNYLGAIIVSPKVEEVTERFEEYILEGNTYDFIFMSGKVDRVEKIRKQDFVNYSTLELKLFLLFGLRIVYFNYIAENYLLAARREQINLAQWMVKQRRGVIMIETGLLFRFGGAKLQELAGHDVFDNKVLLFFPSFVPAFAVDGFKDRLDMFYESSLPVQVPAKTFFIDAPALKLLIELFSAWHNLMVYNDKQASFGGSEELAASAELLALFIIVTNDFGNAGR